MKRLMAFGALLFSLVSCRDLMVACAGTPAHWIISPDSIDVSVGKAVPVTVTELTCADSRRTVVYPPMSVADTMVARVTQTYRYLLARAPGQTTLIIASDEQNSDLVAHIPVIVH